MADAAMQRTTANLRDIDIVTQPVSSPTLAPVPHISYKPALWQAVTPPELVPGATWTQPKLDVSCIPYRLRDAQHSWVVGF